MLSFSRGTIKSGYIIALVLLMTSYFLIFQSIRQVQKESGWVSHSYQVVNKIGELNRSLVEAETGVNSYLITKDLNFLKSYRSGLNNVPVIYDDIRQLTLDNTAQLSKLDTLNRLIDSQFSFMKSRITAFQKAGQSITNEMEANLEGSRRIADSIQLSVQFFQKDEEILMNKRKNKLTGFFNSTLVITIISLFTAIIAIFYSLFTYNKESSAKDEAHKKNVQYFQDLENKIEELKKMNKEVQELRSMEKYTATGRVARTIAHEVRNPLTNISLATEQLQEMAIQNLDSSMLLDMISRNAVRINQLVTDLLDATKAIQLDIQKASINKTLDEALEMAADRIDLSNIQVVKNYSADICEVAVDAEKIKIAFLNIIVNAIEAMEKNKGILQLKTKKEGSKCIIKIEDNGSGMDDETLQKLFEPYFTNKSKGNGLGLTNTQNIILSHGGKISIRSSLGKGTLFIITL